MKTLRPLKLTTGSISVNNSFDFQFLITKNQRSLKSNCIVNTTRLLRLNKSWINGFIRLRAYGGLKIVRIKQIYAGMILGMFFRTTIPAIFKSKAFKKN